MIFPTTSLATLLLLAFALICWGCWANMQKVLAKDKWRFELFYVDFSIGVLLTMMLAVFTLGSMNSQELTFQDNLLITGYRKMAFAMAAGTVYTLGNMLLVAAIAVAGMAVGFPIAFGVAGAVGTILMYSSNPRANVVLLFGGATLFLGAVLVAIFAYISESDALRDEESKALRPDPRAKNSPKPRPGATRGLLLGIFAGVLIALSGPLTDSAREGENGIAPYGLAILFAVGLMAGTMVALPFFINFPTTGTAVQARTYFKGTGKQHFLGFFSGIVWAAGALAVWISLGAPVSVQAAPGVTYAFVQGAPVLAALMGLILWKDLSLGAKSRLLGFGSLALFLAAVGMVSSAYLK